MIERLRLWWRQRKQARCLHVWTGDPPGWRCIWCDTVAPPGAFSQHGTGDGVSYEGEGQWEGVQSKENDG